MPDKVYIKDGKLIIPDNPIIPFIEGDGTGPDIWRATRKVVDAAVEKVYGGRRTIEWKEILAGEKAFHLTGKWLPEETVDAVREYIIAIKGPLTTPVGGGFRSINVTLRQELDLYACVRPVKWIPGVPSPLLHPEQVDVVVFRENTEDIYAGIEWQAGSEGAEKIREFLNTRMGCNVPEDAGIGIKYMSKTASERIMRKALKYAVENGRKSVTVVHKGNIMKYTEGSFKNWCYSLAEREFKDIVMTEKELLSYGGNAPEGKIVVKDRIADNMFQQMLLRPSEYDVIVTPNLNGDYLSDAVAAQVGGLGMAPGANIGDFVALFEATHGSAPDIAGTGKANPGSLILTAVMMLEYMGWKEAAGMILRGLETAISKKIVTNDLAKQMEGAKEVKTWEFADVIIASM
ncbi:MAG: isocitrate dehydrogenase (NADP(+)) [Tepidanaerobacteraceae bacterium]|jgi:isocitrate dehydrogenase|nr:isocitrate dehydrogenase (NADP(+)) [Tepidanaerobacteraceae bacterium]